MREPRREPRLAQEAVAEAPASPARFSASSLIATGRSSSVSWREVDRGHAAVPERPLDPVAAARRRLRHPFGGFLPELASFSGAVSLLRGDPIASEPPKGLSDEAIPPHARRSRRGARRPGDRLGLQRRRRREGPGAPRRRRRVAGGAVRTVRDAAARLAPRRPAPGLLGARGSPTAPSGARRSVRPGAHGPSFIRGTVVRQPAPSRYLLSAGGTLISVRSPRGRAACTRPGQTSSSVRVLIGTNGLERAAR